MADVSARKDSTRYFERSYEKFLIDLDCRSIPDCLREIEIFKYTIYIYTSKKGKTNKDT